MSKVEVQKMKIIGQEKFVQGFTKILEIFSESNGKIKPHSFTIGPSGSGKTSIIKELANRMGINFVSIDGAGLTKEGTSGNSLSKAFGELKNFQNKLTVIFVDEFDKLLIAGNSNSELAHETTTGVQNEFLNALEGSEVSIMADYGKFAKINISKCLFVFAGAFNGEEGITRTRLAGLGVKTEFIGRVPIVFTLKKLKLDELNQIVDVSPTLDQYCELYSIESKTVRKWVKEKLAEVYEESSIGAREIDQLVHRYFVEEV